MKKRGLGAPLPEGIRAKTRFRTLSARGNPFGHVEKRGHSAFVRLDGSIFETEKTLRKPMHRGLPCWHSLGKNAASFNLICLKTNRVQQAVTECTLELSGCILLKKWSLRVQTFPVRAGSWSQDLGLSGRCGASEFGPLQRNKTSPEPETSSISVRALLPKSTARAPNFRGMFHTGRSKRSTKGLTFHAVSGCLSSSSRNPWNMQRALPAPIRREQRSGEA